MMDFRHTNVFVTVLTVLLDCHVVVRYWKELQLLLVVAVEVIEVAVVLAAVVVLAAADRKMKRDEISVQIPDCVTC